MSENLIGEIVDEVTHDVEELFPPRQGGLVDRARKRKADEEAKAREAENAAERIEERSVKAVKVAQEMPEVFVAQVINIGAGQAQRILPSNPYRYRAVVNVVTASSTVIIAKDDAAAYGQNGFYLAAGLNLPLNTRAQVWAYNPGDAVIQVSVLAESYSPEGK